jgi:hypothetical protein
MIYLMFLLGGIGRSIVGTGVGPTWIGRWSIYPSIAFLSAYIGLADLHHLSLAEHGAGMIWVALIASLNLGLGYTQWENWKWMALRFGLPSLILVCPLLYLDTHPYTGLLYYVALSLFAGLFYPVREKAWQRILGQVGRVYPLGKNIHGSFISPVSWLDSARLAEFVAGACILGGLGIL